MALIDDGGLSERVIGCAIRVHKELGPGLLESIYEEAMTYELAENGIGFQRQVRVPVIYRGHGLSREFVLDLLVENKLVLELKCIDAFLQVHESQLLSYMRLGSWQFGLLMNFKVRYLRDGIRRFVL